MKFDYYEYKLSEHWLPALINGDYSGLDDSEENTLDAWLADLPINFPIWETVPDSGHDFRICDISGLFSECCTVKAYFETEGRESELWT